MKRVGLIVNPIAGMGGSVGLKGTDGGLYTKAVKLGATPVAPKRTIQFLQSIKTREGFTFITAPGIMGKTLVEDGGFTFTAIPGHVSALPNPGDTKKAAKEMIRRGVDLIVFVGGDGTARDIYDAVGLSTPCLGVPSGVKMYSPVFAVNPEAAAQVLDAFLSGEVDFSEEEVLDVNEEAYRAGRLEVTLYGYLRVPKAMGLIQTGKEPTVASRNVGENQRAIARYVAQNVEKDTLYLLGPGTTVKAVADELKVDKTLLGVDAVYNGRCVGKDLGEKAILSLIEEYGRVKIVVSPIGGQGFIFGRGNQQFTPRVIRGVGRDNIMIVATRDKAIGLRHMRVDTGDREVDELLRGFLRVIVDYNLEVLKRVI